MKLLLTAALALFSSTALAAPEVVDFRSQYHPGTIEVRQSERNLYLILENGRAIRYHVAVPKPSQSWTGMARIASKRLRPAWSPPAVVRRDHPELPNYIPGGAPNNPMGEAAMLLDRDQYAIHGTSPSMRGSIGTAASYGCVRMLNEDVLDLFRRVPEGTLVVMQP